jgi:hypothetical protein
MLKDGGARLMTNYISMSSLPKRAFNVRKRRKGGNIYLIRFTEIHKINDFIEKLWRLANGHQSLLDILRELSGNENYLEDYECLEDIVSSLQYLENIGFLDLTNIASADKETVDFATDEPSSLSAEIMQRFHSSNGEPWDTGLSDEEKRKVFKRFFRILFEDMQSQNKSVTNMETAETEFRKCLESGYQKNPDAVLNEIREKRGLLDWFFRRRSNRIIMRFRHGVYEGDVNNRL